MKRIDLHNHLDGSLPVATVLELAEMSGVELPAKTVETLRPYLTVEPDCTSLNEYLEKFAIPVSVLQTEACLEKAVYDTMKDLDDRGVCYAELRFAPGQHLQRGLTQTEVTAAAVRDEKLMDYLKEHHILLEVCVTSNVQTKGAASYEEHPILRMLEYGIAVTVNTDNMTVSGTDLAREAELIRSRLGMTDVQERQMLENSICAAFLTDEEKADLRNIIFA